jgi:hypothetical protein
MIDQALALTVSRLNGHFSGRFRTPDDFVVLTPLTDADGKPADIARNRLCLFVVNIAEDQMPRGRPSRGAGLGSAASFPPMHLDIYAMLAASYDPDTYGEGLKLLSLALAWFQANPVLTPQNAPDMPTGLQQLTFEIANLRSEEIGQLWGNLGGRYVPSVLLKMRTVTVDAESIRGIVPSVRTSERTIARQQEDASG